MSFTHKPGSDSGIDYGLLAVFLAWIAMAIALVVLFALRSHARSFVERQNHMQVTRASCVTVPGGETIVSDRERIGV